MREQSDSNNNSTAGTSSLAGSRKREKKSSRFSLEALRRSAMSMVISGRAQLERTWKLALIFLPGLYIMALGILTLVAPDLIVAALAAFFICVGALLCGLAWKLVQLKRGLDHYMKNYEAKVILQP